MRPLPFRLTNLAVVSFALLAACDDGALEPAPVVPVTRAITVDGSTAFAYVALDSVAQQVAVADPAASTAWDFGVFSTTVTLNGGAAGPGDVVAHCLCQNPTTTADLQAMTPANQLAAFDAVSAADIPADAEFQADVLDPVVNAWYAGSGAGASLAAGRSWIIREGTAVILLAKFRVAGISGATAAGPTQLTVEYAVQSAPGGAFGAVTSATINPAAAPVYLDLTSGQVTNASNWDLRFDGWTITVNGGVSGSGSVRAVLDTSTPFANIDAAYAGTAPGQAYRADRFAGVFSATPWYRYNITGTDNQIWPTFQVYLVKRGSAVFKVQLTSYYSGTGTPRQISVRYAQLSR